MADIDPSLHRQFRRTLEEKLELARRNNSRMVVSWELSKTLESVELVCGETFFDATVVDHIATSLTRMLGVGRRMGLVDREVRHFTMRCTSLEAGTPSFVQSYEVA